MTETKRRERFQLTHPTRGATTCDVATSSYKQDFNSHTPHGVRLFIVYLFDSIFNFNSHTPHGVRPLIQLPQLPRASFQLTHPTRGATLCLPQILRFFRYFNSHTPHGVRPPESNANYAFVEISTHTPHTGCDCSPNSKKDLYTRFQLTHPTRGATQCLPWRSCPPRHFNSHTPHGVRQLRRQCV